VPARMRSQIAIDTLKQTWLVKNNISNSNV